MVNASDSESRGVRAPLGSNRVVSLSKAHLLPESTGNTQEAVASSQHDRKIVYRDVKNQSTNQPSLLLKHLIFIFLFVVTAAGVVPCGSPK